LKKQPSGIVADDQSVRLALLVHEVGVNDTAGAGHVFNDDSRIARNMFAEMPRDRSRIGVVSSAGGKSDDQAKSLTLAEIIIGRSGVAGFKLNISVHKNARQKISIEPLDLRP
jgi:hypothetical protein